MSFIVCLIEWSLQFLTLKWQRLEGKSSKFWYTQIIEYRRSDKRFISVLQLINMDSADEFTDTIDASVTFQNTLSSPGHTCPYSCSAIGTNIFPSRESSFIGGCPCITTHEHWSSNFIHCRNHHIWTHHHHHNLFYIYNFFLAMVIVHKFTQRLVCPLHLFMARFFAFSISRLLLFSAGVKSCKYPKKGGV